MRASSQFLSLSLALACLLLHLYVSPSLSYPYEIENIIATKLQAPDLVSRRLSSYVRHTPHVTSREFGSDVQKIDVSLYYDSLCPFCFNFIANTLAPAVNSDLMDIVNIRMVPWGNAFSLPNNNTFICQHGENECYLNIIQACAIKLWPDLKRHFKFIQCIEESFGNENSTKAVWEACADRLSLPKHDVQYCYDSGLGKRLVMQYEQEIRSLAPPHKYVPWMVFNGTPLLTDYRYFVYYVCKSHEDRSKPNACTSLARPTKTSVQLVCQRDDQRSAKGLVEHWL